jgi:hypothetical protein
VVRTRPRGATHYLPALGAPTTRLATLLCQRATTLSDDRIAQIRGTAENR